MIEVRNVPQEMEHCVPTTPEPSNGSGHHVSYIVGQKNEWKRSGYASECIGCECQRIQRYPNLAEIQRIESASKDSRQRRSLMQITIRSRCKGVGPVFDHEIHLRSEKISSELR